MEKHVAVMKKAPNGATVRIVEPANGATVSSPVRVVMQAEGIQVVPAGSLDGGTGHHHLIINAAPPEYGQVTPKDASHLHFGKGGTDANLDLAPGEYTITAQFADGLHRSYGKDLADSVTIIVQ